MIVADYIQPIHSIDSHASRQECIDIMMDTMCYQLPVQKDNKPYGTIELDECIHSLEDTIDSLVNTDLISASVYFNTHIFDVLQLMEHTHTEVCSVLGQNLEWIGIITKSDTVKALASTLTIEQPGVVILLEMAAHQYSVNEISRIVESENSQLLGLWVSNVAESGRIRASLKLNTQNAERIINGFQRFGYEIIATFGDKDYKENVEKRFQSLMKYIDI